MPAYSKTTWVDGSLPAIDASKLNKIEQGIFDSLRQDGSTTMSGQLVTTAGSAATPAIAPTGDSNTGIFFPAADTIAFGEGGLEAMRINSSGQLGIGCDPTSALEVKSAQGVIKLASTTGTNSTYHKIDNTGGTLTLGIDNSTGSSQFGVGNYAAGLWHSGNYNLTFGTNNSVRMTISGGGNVGIGTTSPTNKLQIDGVTANTSCINAIANTTAGQSFGIALSAGTNSSDYALNIRNAAQTSQLLHVTGAGNVGIGTTSIPSVFGTTVKVAGSTGATIETSATNVNLRQFVSDSLSLGVIGTSTNHPFSFYTNDTERMRITSTGNVGVGKFDSGFSPVQQLTVSQTSGGTFALTTNRSAGTSASPKNMDIGFYGYLDSEKARIRSFDQSGSANDSPLIFYTNDGSNVTEKMRITGAGNVGIGVNPNVELHVKGTGEILRLETTAATGDNFIRFYAPSATTQGYVGYTSAANNNMSINQVLNNDLLFFTNNTERMRIQNSGGVIPSANNTYELGSATFRWSTIYAQNALNTSDARLKTNVEPSSLGLDFINQLNPVQYRWIEGGNTVDKVQIETETVEITPAIPAQPEVMDEEGNIIQEAIQEVPAVTEERPVYETVVTPREGVRTHFGLIAQEVKAALPDGLDFAGWCLADKDDPNSTQSLGYTQLIAPMIKAIQELKAEIEALKVQLNK